MLQLHFVMTSVIQQTYCILLLYYIVLYYIILCYILYCVILYYIILYWNDLCYVKTSNIVLHPV